MIVARIMLGRTPRAVLATGGSFVLKEIEDEEAFLALLEDRGVTHIEVRGFLRYLATQHAARISSKLPLRGLFVPLDVARACAVFARTPGAEANLTTLIKNSAEGSLADELEALT